MNYKGEHEKMENSYQQEERELLLVDYIWRVLRRWRSILAAMVIGAVVLGGVKYLKDSRDLKKQLEEQETLSPEEQLDEMMSRLTEEEQSAVNQVMRFENMKAEREEYIENAAVMQLDRTAVNKNVLQYHVEFGNNSAELLRAYKSSFLTEDVMQDIADAADNIEVSDVQDLISVSYDAENGLELTTDSKVVFDDETSRESMYITIRGLSKEGVMAMTEVVEDAVSAYAKKAQEIYGEHKITLTNEFYQKGKDDDVGTTQDNVYNIVYDYQNKINTLSSGFSEEQTAVLETYNSLSKQSDDDTEAEEISATASVSKKWILLGAFLGACLIAGWEMLVWALGGKVNSPEELIENFPVYNFGIYEEEKREKKRLLSGIDSLFYRICYSGRIKLTREQSFDMILAGIVEKAKIADIKQICLIKIGEEDEAGGDFIRRLIDGASLKGVVLEEVGNPCINGNNLSKMGEIRQVIICGKIQEMKSKDFERALQICEEYNVQVMGTVFIV